MSGSPGAGAEVLGIGAALVAAVAYGLASVLQAVGARRAETAAAPGAGAEAGGLARQPAYLVGVVLDGAAWLVSLVALRTLPLFAVQALLAGSLAVTAVLGTRVLGVRLGRSGAVAVLLAVVGLALVAAGARPGRPQPAPPGTAEWCLAVAVALAVLAVVPAGWGRRWLTGRTGALVLSTAAGAAYSVAALCARLVEPASVLGLLAEPATWAVVVSGVAGTLLYGRSLAGDGVVVATAALWVVEVVVGGAAGLVLLGDGVRAGWAVPVVVGVVLSLAACVQLARPAAAASPPG
jgi:drug/metabolite transporter (DMT)-like permease